MVLCENCGRPYICQTYRTGKQGRVTELQTYRHRKKAGHCLNREFPAHRIESLVWQAVVSLLRDPEQLIKGYEELLEQQKVTRSRQINHLETLRKKLAKLEQSRDKLNTIYLDEDIKPNSARVHQAEEQA